MPGNHEFPGRAAEQPKSPENHEQARGVGKEMLRIVMRRMFNFTGSAQYRIWEYEEKYPDLSPELRVFFDSLEAQIGTCVAELREFLTASTGWSRDDQEELLTEMFREQEAQLQRDKQ